MPDPTLNTLTQRLDRLEREVRCWRGLSLVSGAMLGVLLLLGAATPGAPVSRATPGTLNVAPALELRDGDGRRRALLAVSTDGQPVLGLTDQNGTPRAGMTVLPSGKAQIMP